MFDFHNLHVYQKSKKLTKEVLFFLKKNKQVDYYINNQLKRATISITINIAEGSGKCTKRDKRNFYYIARGSVYECVSLLEIIYNNNHISKRRFNYFYKKYEIISKMLLGLIKSQEK